MTDRGAACLNCGTPLIGHYCSTCGQRDIPPEPPLRELLTEAWGEFINVDGKVMATLRLLLTRPGELTRQYLLGHRARFMPPLRLYLTCTVAFFLMNAIRPTLSPSRASAFARPTKGVDSVQLRKSLDSVAALDKNATPMVKRVHRNAVLMRKRDFIPKLSEYLPRALFVIMPAFALLLAVAYRSRRRVYAAHLIVSLHLHAFIFSMFAIDALIVAIPPRAIRLPLFYATVAWMLAYIPMALRRVYDGRWVPTLARTLALESAYAGLLAVALGVFGVYLVFATAA